MFLPIYFPDKCWALILQSIIARLAPKIIFLIQIFPKTILPSYFCIYCFLQETLLHCIYCFPCKKLSLCLQFCFSMVAWVFIRVPSFPLLYLYRVIHKLHLHSHIFISFIHLFLSFHGCQTFPR